MSHYDVIVIGSGAGGGTLVHRLAPSGKRVLQPLIDAPPPVHPYAKGTWGPAEADRIMSGHGRWHEPWIAS